MIENPDKSEQYYNDNYKRYVGWSVSEQDFDKEFFSNNTVVYVSEKLYSLLKCLRKDKRPIKVSDRTITSIMDDIYTTYRPQLGNMYTMLTIPPAEPRDDMKTLRDMVIEVIFTQIKTEYEIEENNRGLSVWTTVLGDFNKHGLRQYSTIKINEKNINKVRFNMNY